MIWRLGHHASLLLDRPRILAILNLTPDSFSDGGRYTSAAAAAAAAWRWADEGADLIDLGGESTRPGAQRVPGPEQIRRIEPVIRAIRSLPGRAGAIPISVDTTLSSVAAAALALGANAVNDVSAGEDDPEMFPLVAARGAGLILMHRLAQPERDSYSDRYAVDPSYGDVVTQVRDYLAARTTLAIGRGVPPEALVVDPGLGFGKSVDQSLSLIRGTNSIAALGFPVLSAVSRKSFVGRVSLGRDSAPAERLAGSLAFSTVHFQSGAHLFRVHDVREHREALDSAWRIRHGSGPKSAPCAGPV